jgi:hypothetical protein
MYLWYEGKAIARRMPMIDTTMRSSMSVTPAEFRCLKFIE